MAASTWYCVIFTVTYWSNGPTAQKLKRLKYAKKDISAQKKETGKNPRFPKKDANYRRAKGPYEKKRQKKK